MKSIRHHLENSSNHARLSPDVVEELLTLALQELQFDAEAPSATLSLVVSTSLSLVVAVTLSCRSGSSIVAPPAVTT